MAALRLNPEGQWHECTSDPYSPCACADPALIVGTRDDYDYREAQAAYDDLWPTY